MNLNAEWAAKTEWPSLDLLQASLFFLMNRYLHSPSDHTAAAVVEHLEQLNQHPEIALCPAQRQVYARLINDWRARLPCRGEQTLH